MKIAICDDNQIMHSFLSEQLRGFGEQNEIYLFSNSFALVSFVMDEKKGDIDALFIEAELKDDDGIEVAASLQEIYPSLQVVFLAEHNRFADLIFHAKPTYFLVRDNLEYELFKAYQRLEDNVYESMSNSIQIMSDGNYIRLSYEKINYIESSGRKLLFFVGNSCYETNATMQYVLEQLPQNFVQCHRSYIININKVQRLYKNVVSLYNQRELPVSRSYIQEIKMHLVTK